VNKRKILVPLGDKSYEVTLEAGILNNISEELLKIGITKNRKILVISNEEISNLYGEKFLNNLKDNKFQAKMFLIKAGESYKNLKTLSEIYDVAFEFGLDRNSIIIALGGGIVGDVSGFAASLFKRGLKFINLPTTLLSQVDSSIGGKTGTANKSIKGVYSNEKVNTFVSVFPTKKPKFILAVMLDAPKINSEYIYNYRDGSNFKLKGSPRNTAGWNSVEAAGHIVEKIGPILATKYSEVN